MYATPSWIGWIGEVIMVTFFFLHSWHSAAGSSSRLCRPCQPHARQWWLPIFWRVQCEHKNKSILFICHENISTQIDEEGDWESDMEQILIISATHSHTLHNYVLHYLLSNNVLTLIHCKIYLIHMCVHRLWSLIMLQHVKPHCEQRTRSRIGTTTSQPVSWSVHSLVILW